MTGTGTRAEGARDDDATACACISGRGSGRGFGAGFGCGCGFGIVMFDRNRSLSGLSGYLKEVMESVKLVWNDGREKTILFDVNALYIVG